MEKHATKRRFRFGVFEADEQTEELHKQGRRLSLQGQPLQILLMLLDRPGELVTRAEVRQRLWPDGTFVDFDHSLNTAISKIRDALGDSAASPRFVETLAKRGYRFVAPVEVTDGSAPGAQFNAPSNSQPVPVSPPAAVPEAIPTPLKSAEPSRSFLTRADELPPASRPLVRSLFFLIQLMYLCFYLISLARLSVAEEIIRSLEPHTTWTVALLVITAIVGIPTRLYLISAVAFDSPSLGESFLRIFPLIFPLDDLWSLSPFLLVHQVGYGLVLGMTAILLYVPFAQRSLILMGAGAPSLERQGDSSRRR